MLYFRNYQPKKAVICPLFFQRAMGENYVSDKLITYMVPKEFPLEGSPEFTVSVNGVYTGVYNDLNYWKGNVGFCYFDFQSGYDVWVSVTSATSFASYKLFPASTQINSKRNGNTIHFKINKADHNFTIVYDKDYQGKAIHLFANSIDKKMPDPADTTVIFFAPGYHDLRKLYKDGDLVIGGDQIVYIAGGAVVDGEISIYKGTRAKEGGRGMIMNTRNQMLLTVAESLECKVEGIVVHGHRAPGWITGINRSQHITFDGLKIISTRNASTDGCDISNSSHITLRNLFIRSCDDAIAIKGLMHGMQPADCLPNKNMLFENLQLWNDCNNAFAMGAETRASVYENIRI